LKKVRIEPIHDKCHQHGWYPIITEKYQHEMDWLATFDDDEYFYDSRRRKINDILAMLPDEVGSAIVPWLIFGHNNKIYSPPCNVTRLEYFTAISELLPENECVKPISRVKNLNHNEQWYVGAHMHRHSGLNRTLNNEPVEYVNECMTNVVNLNTCLAHYCMRSMEDFVARCKKWSTLDPNKWDAGAIGNKAFVDSMTSKMQDTRMNIYVDELKLLLSQCNHSI